ncbi:MAG: hypothetical protein AAFW73_18850 [Bacteroidota bacterium]
MPRPTFSWLRSIGLDLLVAAAVRTDLRVAYGLTVVFVVALMWIAGEAKRQRWYSAYHFDKDLIKIDDIQFIYLDDFAFLK